EIHAAQLEAQMLFRLGDLTRSEGDYERALEVYETFLTRAREADARLLIATAWHRLGQMAHLQGDLAKASTLLQDSLKMHREAGNKHGIAECLAALAGVSASQGHPNRAVRLFGAADALLERLMAPLTPADRTQYDTDLAATRSQLDAPTWQAAWAEGRALTLDQAIVYALETTGDD
ncbi:MAG: tetratricopeptide repeat protein, partial [Chloroflexia bacterium]